MPERQDMDRNEDEHSAPDSDVLMVVPDDVLPNSTEHLDKEATRDDKQTCHSRHHRQTRT